MPVGQAVARAMPRTLDASVHDRSLREGPSGMRALLVEGMHRLAHAYQDQVIDSELGLRRHALGQVLGRRLELEADPLRARPPERMPADHVAQHVYDVAADVRASRDQEIPDQGHDHGRGAVKWVAGAD